MRKAPLVALAFAGLCAGCSSAAPRPAPIALKKFSALKASYIAPLPFSVQFGLFRNAAAPAWGEGKVLAAFWRRDFGFETELTGLAFSPRRGPLVIERARGDEPKATLHALGRGGATVESAEVRHWFTGLAVLRGKDGESLYAHSGTSLEPLDGKGREIKEVPHWAVVDLDGDGEQEFLTHSGYGKPRLASYARDGKRLWSRGGVRPPAAWSSGAPVFLAEHGVRQTRLLAVGRGGKLLHSVPSPRVHRLLAAAGRDERGPRLAGVSHAYPNQREVLSLSRLGPKGLETLWEKELAWSRPEHLVVADLRGDGKPLLVLATEGGWLLVFSETGELLAERRFSEMYGFSHLAVADLDGDGLQEVLAALKGIPPELFAIGVVPDPGPWSAKPKMR